MQIFPHNRWLRLAILLCLLLASISLSLSLLLPRILDLNSYRYQLAELLQKRLNRQVSLGNCRFSWLLVPEFTFNDLHIKEKGGGEEFLSARTISFRLAILPLLKKKIKLREIAIDKAIAVINRNELGKTNIDDLLEQSSSDYDLQIKGIRITNSVISWHDLSTKPECFKLKVSDLNLAVDRLTRGKKNSFKLSAKVDGASPGTVTAVGSIILPVKGDLLPQIYVDANMELKQLEYWRFWPYIHKIVPFASPGGTIGLNLNLKGSWKNLYAKGTFQADNPKIIWPGVFRSNVSPKQLRLSTELEWTESILKMQQIKLGLNGFSISGDLTLNDLNGKDPSISVKATTEPFDYNNVKSYIPFGIIDDDAAEFIEKRIRGGIFKLTTGTLNAKFSQLSRFCIGNNANTLYIIGTADQASIQYGEKTPTFRKIQGTLEMKGRNFNLIGMSGSFGNAPFTLDGSIKEYATEGVASHYPFIMNIAPQPAEVAWLAEHAGAGLLRFHGNGTTMRIQGEGPTSAYRLAGEWQLENSAYNYPELISKPAGIPNNLTFSAVLGSDGTRFTSVSYQLPPFRLSGKGLLRYSSNIPYLEFDLESNRFYLNQTLPILTGWRKYQLQGGVHAHVLGHGDPRSLDSMKFSGNVALAGFSLRPDSRLAHISDVNTRFSFKDNIFTTSDMSIRYGGTPLNIKGRLSNLENPDAELFVSSPLVRLGDFGIYGKEAEIKATQCSAQLGLHDRLLSIRNLSGKLPRTVLSASGSVRIEDRYDINLRVASSYLDLDEMVPILASIGTPEHDPTHKVTPFNLKIDLTAGAGTCLDAKFNKMTASIAGNEKMIKLKRLDSPTLGGNLSMQGSLALADRQPPEWSTSFKLEQALAGEVLKVLGIKREIKGRTDIQGKLTATGNGLPEIRKTVSGNISLKVDRGTLRRFNVLSKVISILNVSQLLSFSLPDMAKDGMPFNEIKATLSVKDGVFTTRDLFLDSNVMHLTTVGSFDVAHETLNMLIGIQPLQTFDRIISVIPVVGWILSGGDGSMITTYFEAKGSWENPEVTAIPVKTMAIGTLDIFRRIFELPVRLFTDSGEVILGNRKELPGATEDAVKHNK